MTEHDEGHRNDRTRDLTPGEEAFYSADEEDRSADGRLERIEEEERLEAGGAAPAAPRRERQRTEVGRDDPDRVTGEATLDEPRTAATRGRRGRSEPMAESDSDAIDAPVRLFPAEETDSLRARWDRIQTEFVDQPRDAVEQADGLVGDVMQRLTEGFSGERARLERQWDRGDSVSTEDLRMALKRYRAFFDRLLTILRSEGGGGAPAPPPAADLRAADRSGGVPSPGAPVTSRHLRESTDHRISTPRATYARESW